MIGMCDGSVHSINASEITDEDFKCLLQKSDGKMVDIYPNEPQLKNLIDQTQQCHCGSVNATQFMGIDETAVQFGKGQD